MCFESFTDGHKPVSPEIFLDTSIHCCFLKGPLFQERLSAVLRVFLWKSTSSYAKVEFANVVLAQAQYYLRKLDELGSLAKTLDFIGNVLPAQHREKIVWSFNLLQGFEGNDAERTERAVLSLRRLMKLGMRLVENNVDQPVANGTDCYWAKLGIRKKRDGRFVWESPRCKRTQKRCRLDDFFEENRDVFSSIKNAIDALPPDKMTDELRGFSEIIEQALEDPPCLLDYQRGCKRLADAIIAVDSLNYRNMFTQNVFESQVLTEVLGQVLYYLPPNPEKGVLVRRPFVQPDSVDAE